jgi:hypothetical protein
MGNDVLRLTVCSALAGMSIAGASAQPIDQDLAWAPDQEFVSEGQTVSVPVACFDGQDSFIVLTPENVGLCSDLSLATVDKFNAAFSDGDRRNDPIAMDEVDRALIESIPTASGLRLSSLTGGSN